MKKLVELEVGQWLRNDSGNMVMIERLSDKKAWVIPANATNSTKPVMMTRRAYKGEEYLSLGSHYATMITYRPIRQE